MRSSVNLVKRNSEPVGSCGPASGAGVIIHSARSNGGLCLERRPRSSTRPSSSPARLIDANKPVAGETGATPFSAGKLIDALPAGRVIRRLAYRLSSPGSGPTKHAFYQFAGIDEANAMRNEARRDGGTRGSHFEMRRAGPEGARIRLLATPAPTPTPTRPSHDGGIRRRAGARRGGSRRVESREIGRPAGRRGAPNKSAISRSL